MREGGMRVRMAGFRSRLRDRMRMRHRAMFDRQTKMMRRGPMMSATRRDVDDAARGQLDVGRGNAPMMRRGGRGGRPGALGNDSIRAMRRPPPRTRPDTGT